LLEILSKEKNPSDTLNQLPDAICTPELQLPCAEGEPFTILDHMKANARFATASSINTIDGVRVDWPDGFGLIRASNTTPVLVLRFEGHTPQALHRIEADMLALLRSVKPDATFAEAAH
jgi:phosphomannomutase